jgi:hypothetical protein
MRKATLWNVRVTIVVKEENQYVVCIVELHATANNSKTLLQKDAFMANLYSR